MESETKTGLIIGLGSVVLVFFAMLIAIITSASKRKILEKENKLREMEKEKQIDLFRATVKAEEDQKFKIASNLHDQIIPILLQRTRNINNQIGELEKKGIEVDELKKEIVAFTTLSDEIRDIAHDLIPKLFTSFGLLKSIEAFIKNLSSGSKSAAEFHNNTIFSGELPFTKNDQLTIYRISLEILNNLSKHGKYDYLHVSLEDMKDNFTLLFSHNGAGVTNEEISKFKETNTGIGLKSLDSRLLLLNGVIDYYKDADVSYVKLIIPINRNERNN